MEMLLSNQSELSSYIVSAEKQPDILPKYNKLLPVINLAEFADPETLVEPIIRASQDFGFFQVTNHGLEDIMHDMMNVAEELFGLPDADKMEMFTEDPNEIYKIHTSHTYRNISAQFWRVSLAHPVNPPEEFMHLWPLKPTNYRQVTEAYSTQVRSFGLKLLELICQGLGIRSDHFVGELTKIQLQTINYYPPCREPSLVLGLPRHHDPNTITILQQGDVSGLQVFNQGEWLTVEPIPNAFIVILGRQLQFISNGKIQTVNHQAVTNSTSARTTLASFITPSMECIIEPAELLVDASNPRKYKIFKYKEYNESHGANLDENECVLKRFML